MGLTFQQEGRAHPVWKGADESVPAFAARAHPAQVCWISGSHRSSNHSGLVAAFQGNELDLCCGR